MVFYSLNYVIEKEINVVKINDRKQNSLMPGFN